MVRAGVGVNGVVYKRPPHRKGAPARAKPWAFTLDLGPDAAGKRRQVWRSGFATKTRGDCGDEY
jgi:hypothetical protein